MLPEIVVSKATDIFQNDGLKWTQSLKHKLRMRKNKTERPRDWQGENKQVSSYLVKGDKESSRV